MYQAITTPSSDRYLTNMSPVSKVKFKILLIIIFVFITNDLIAGSWETRTNEAIVCRGVSERVGGSVKSINGYVGTVEPYILTDTGGLIENTPKEVRMVHYTMPQTNYFIESYQVFYCQDGNWSGVSSITSFNTFNDTGTCDGLPTATTVETLPCIKPPPCSEEKELKINECGGSDNVDWSNWIDDTCSGAVCKPCTGLLEDGQETRGEASDRCAGKGLELSYYNDSECQGYCGCTEEQYQKEISKCGAGVVTFIETTCQAICRDCEDSYNDAVKDCAQSGAIVRNWRCDTLSNGSIKADWDCLLPDETVIYPLPGERGKTEDETTVNNPTSQPSTQQPPTTPNTETPSDNPTDTNNENEWLSKIKENSDTQIEQNNLSNQELANQTSKLDWIGNNLQASISNQGVLNRSLQYIGENQKITADNTKAIGDLLAMEQGNQGKEEALLSDIKNKLSETTGYEGINTVPDPDLSTDLTEDIPEESDLYSLLSSGINQTSNLNVITNSSVSFSDSESCIILPNPFNSESAEAVCFSDYYTILRTMGFLLLALSSYTALTIAVGVKG